jgi:rhomboid protease GluP
VCPYCGASRSSVAKVLPPFSKSLRSINAPQAILYFCLVIFGLSLVVGFILPGSGFTFLRPSSGALNVMGVNLFAKDPSRWWTMVTGVFLHIGALHLAFNLYGLHVLGRYLEGPMKSSFLWVVFMISALVGAYVTATVGHNITAGASGGLFGWMGASLYHAFRTGGFNDPVFRSLLFWGGLSLLFGFTMGGRIDNFSHMGGLVTGLFLTSVWTAFSRYRVFDRVIQMVGLALFVLVVFSYVKQLPYLISVFKLIGSI